MQRKSSSLSLEVQQKKGISFLYQSSKVPPPYEFLRYTKFPPNLHDKKF